MIFQFPAVSGSSCGNMMPCLDYVLKPPQQEFGFFQLGSPSVIAGSSGTGKSTFMFDMLEKQRKAENVLGYYTFGLRYLVLQCDRGKDAFGASMHRMGLDANKVPVQFLSPDAYGNGEAANASILEQIELGGAADLPQVVFIEGADLLVKENTSEFVGLFVIELQKIATHYHIAFILSVGAPKMKAGEGYTAKRDCVIGTAMWARVVDTVAVIQYPDGRDTEAKRVLYLLPRDTTASKHDMVFNGGKLVPETAATLTPLEPKEVTWFKSQHLAAQTDPTKRWFTCRDLELGLNISHGTAHNYIGSALANRHIIGKTGKRVGAKQYRFNDSPTNPSYVPDIVTVNTDDKEEISQSNELTLTAQLTP